MHDVLAFYVGSLIGINYLEPAEPVVAYLSAVNERYLTVTAAEQEMDAPTGLQDTRQFHFPMSNVRSVVEVERSQEFSLPVKSGARTRVAVHVVVELDRQVFPKKENSNWVFGIWWTPSWID